MKNFLFVSLTALLLCGFSTKATAQFNRHKKKQKQESTERAPVFIDDIDNRTEQSGGPVLSRADIKSPKTTNSAKPVAVADVSEPHLQAYQFKYGQILDRDVESITNASLFHFIDTWWGTPYRYGGSTQKGVDCSAFSSTLISSVFGVQLPRTARDQYKVCQKLDEDELKEGDLVFFNTRGGISHVGVSLGGKYFVHASTSNGVMISSLDEDYYNHRFVAGGRVAPLEQQVATVR